MDAIFSTKDLQDQLNAASWEQDDGNTESRQVYLGTVFALYPSGKFYTCFANSNVTDAEASKDEQWREQAERELETIGASLVSGEGDPCDLFVAQYRDKPGQDEDDQAEDDGGRQSDAAGRM